MTFRRQFIRRLSAKTEGEFAEPTSLYDMSHATGKNRSPDIAIISIPQNVSLRLEIVQGIRTEVPDD